MSNTPENLRYARSHEWVRDDGDGRVTVGITDHAQSELGDVVYVELPEVGRQVAVGEEISVVESVKAASDIYAPVAGEVVAVNEDLVDSPETVNAEPYEGGWMFQIAVSDDNPELLNAGDYLATLDAQD